MSNISNMCHILFHKVFIGQEENVYFVDPTFSFKGATFQEVRDQYLNYNLEDLRDILVLYDMMVVYKNCGGSDYYRHQDKLRKVTHYIEDRISEKQKYEDTNDNTEENFDTVVVSASELNNKVLEDIYKDKLKSIKSCSEYIMFKIGKKKLNMTVLNNSDDIGLSVSI